MPYYDAHCHLQDIRLTSSVDQILADYGAMRIEGIVVNGTSEADWERVAALAEKASRIIPSYGLHPWHAKDRSEEWKSRLCEFWEKETAQVGEIGLDRWIRGYDIEDQLEVFRWQLRQAIRLDKACSIHCLKAFGLLESVLRSEERLPSRGFLLHSFGGSLEMMRSFADLGAYFSMSAYFAWDRKERQREVFRNIPLDRLLIETDAPDMGGPESVTPFKLDDQERNPINDPRNLVSVYEFAAELLGLGSDELEGQVEENFRRLFGVR